MGSESKRRRIVVTGATGLVGQALCAVLVGGGHDVRTLSRRPDPGAQSFHWDPERGLIDERAFEGADAVVHLAGENVADGRWNAERKERILKSRVESTRLLAETLAALHPRPECLVSASAIGYYGMGRSQSVDESCAPGDDFLAEVCKAWESAAQPAIDAGIRTAWLRIGVVLSRQGGALAKMLPAFRMGVGGKVGKGEQTMSWVSLDDLVAMIAFLIEDPSLRGPFNAVAPQAVSNAEFSHTLGKVLHRPALLPVPGALLKLALGREMADALLLSGVRVLPRRLLEAGFQWQYPELDAALRAALQS